MNLKRWFGHRLGWIGVAAFLLVGCAAFGLKAAKSFDERLAEAYGIHTAVVEATVTAGAAGTIGLADLKQVQTMELSSRAILDTAKSLAVTGNTTAAENNLTLAMTALVALQSYLNAPPKKGGS